MATAITKRATTLRGRVLRIGAVLFALAALLITLVLVAWSIPMGDFAPVRPIPSIVAQPSDPRLEWQAEPHTCGFHAASTVYKAYGLDVTERRLRARLGVDNRSIVFDSSTTGCLHPDMYRALNQDGFDVVPLDLDSPAHSANLKSHLEAGGLAMALIRRHDSGVMHWVVLGSVSDGAVNVLDPLEREIQLERYQDYWEDRLLSVIKVQPSVGEPVPVWKLHLRGAVDMVAAFRRSG